MTSKTNLIEPNSGLGEVGNLTQVQENNLALTDILNIKKSNFQEFIGLKLMKLFISFNIFVLTAIFACLLIDYLLLEHGNHNQIVTKEVIITLIGGTVAELGAIALVFSKWLFSTETP